MKDALSARWETAILVCGKCGKKLDGGFGEKGKRSLAKSLRRAIGGGKGRRARVGIVEVKCLGVCPKGAVTVVNAARPGEWLLVEAGAEVDAVVARLGIPKRDIP